MVGWGRNWMNSTQSMGLSAWHHVAWVYSNSAATRQIYIDGASATMATGTNANAYDGATGEAEATGAFTLGYSNGMNQTAGHNYFNGQIDEFRIDSAARSSSWIALCYETQLPATRGTSVVTLSSPIAGSPAAPALSFPVNNSINQPTTGVSLS